MQVIFAAWWNEATGWAAPVVVSDPQYRAVKPVVAVANNGDAVVAWGQYGGGTGIGIYGNRFSAQSGWQVPTRLASIVDVAFVTDPIAISIATDIVGNAVVGWIGENSVASAARLKTGSGWEPAIQLDTNVRGLAIAVGSSTGDAALVWGNISSQALRGARWALASPSLTPLEPLEAASPTGNVQAVIDATGDITAVWSKSLDISNTEIHAARNQGTSWSSPETIQSLMTSADLGKIGADARGNVTAVWSQNSAIYANRYEPSRGWRGATILDYFNGVPQLAVAPNGDAMATWVRPGNNTYWASRYRALITPSVPLAHAGADQAVTEQATVSLMGAGLASSGSTIASYLWEQMAGPAVTLSAPTSPQTSFVAPAVAAPTTLTFRLRVTDSSGRSAEESVDVLVRRRTLLALSAPSTVISLGQSFVVNASLSGSPSPQGSVTLLNNGSVLSTQPITAGVAQFTVSSLGVGSYVFTATYQGDGAFGAASSAPLTITVTDAPRSDITAPANGAQYSLPSTITVTAASTAAVGRLRTVEIFHNGTLLATRDIPAPGTTSSTFSASLTLTTAGQHAFYARVTDDRGVVGQSATRTVTALAVPTVSIVRPVTGTTFVAPDLILLQAEAASGNGQVTQVEFLANGNVIGVSTAAPFSLAWSNIASGTYSVTARVTDVAGMVATSAPSSIVVAAQPSVAVTSHADGAVVQDDVIAVLRGTVQAPPNSSVTVNGLVAQLTEDGGFVLNNVPLQTGSNTLLVVVTTPDGQTTTQTLVVQSAGRASFSFEALPSEGFAPLTVQLRLANRDAATFSRIEMRCSDDAAGISMTVIQPVNCNYVQPGVYTAAVDVFTQAPGQPEVLSYAATQAISVTSVEALSGSLQNVYLQMLYRLRAGNIDGALTGISDGQQEKYRDIFSSFPNLAAAVDMLGTIQSGRISRDFAEFVIISGPQQQPEAHLIYLVKGEDGIWRIDGM